MDFQAIVAAGEVGLQAMVAANQPETLQLEFKAESGGTNGQPWLKNGRLSDEIRKVLAKAMSGMANSAGGVLVLGVEGRKDAATGIDGAAGLVPFANLGLVNSLVTQAASDLLQPRHDGIRIEMISSANGGGYIVVDIPRSERRPHRSEAKDQKQYFKRAAGSTFAMEHYDIEDAFRRNQSAELRLEATFQGGPNLSTGSGVRIHHLRIELSLENVSAATAKFPSILLVGARTNRLQRPKYHEAVQSIVYEGPNIRIISGADVVIHPGETRVFESLGLRVAKVNSDLHHVDEEKLIAEPLTDFSIGYRIFAEDSRVREGELKISVSQLLTAIG